MKKFLFTILISFFVVFSTSFFGCSSSITCWVDYGAFSGVVEYNGEISIDELSLIKQDGKSTSTVEITPSMVVSCDDTTTVGKKTLVVEYANQTYTFEFFVKYKVEFLVNNEVYNTQFVLSADEIELPETPTVENCDFVSWTPNVPETINNNVSIKANFTIAESGIPVLFEENATYGDTLSSIELPKNNLGSWEFVNDKSTPVGNAGEQYFDVQFVPKDESLIVTKTDTVKIKVAKKTLTFKNVVDTFTYDGTVKVPTFDFDTKEKITTEYIPYYLGDAIDVNTYEYEIDVNEPNYEGFYSGTLTIDPVEIEIVIDDAHIKITDSVPQTYSYKVSDKNGNNLSQNLMELLEFEIVKPNYSHAGNYEISATFNKKNFVVGVNNFEKGTLFVAKVEFNFDGEEPDFVSGKKVTYGNLLSTLEFANTDVRGTWTWTTPSYKVLTPTTITATALFTPKEDKDYLTSTMEIEVPVAKKRLDFVVNNNNFTYDATNHSILYSLEGVETVDDATVTVVGNTPKTNAGTYEVVLSVDSNDLRYQGSLNTSLVINKAKMADFTTVYQTTWSKTLLLNNVNLLSGYKWINPLTSLTEIGEQSYLAEFTPTDLDNYEIEQGLLKINVDKATAEISTNDEYSFEYNPNGYFLENITASHDEATLNYAYSLNHTSVEKISTVGTYVVEISLNETTHYKKANKTIEVVVNKATNKDNVSNVQTATYGQKLSEINLPESETGTWSWLTGVETFVGNAGTSQHKLVFKPTDEVNYETREEVVIFTIAKKKVAKPNLEQQSPYTGLNQLAEVDETYYTASQTNNMIDVNTYSIELLLRDPDNYCWMNENENLSKLTLTFSITKVDNSWKQEPSISGWEYLSTEKEPSAESTFGNNNLNISYKTESGVAVSRDERLPAGKYVAIFTVPGNDNYSTLTMERLFTVSTYKVEIPQLNQATVYNTQVQTPIVNATYYTVSCQEEIKNAKTYNLTLTLNDNSFVWKDLTTESKTLVFTVDKATNNQTIASQTATYGQKLSDFTLPNSTIGVWSWEKGNDSVVGNAGTTTNKAIFTSTNENYYDSEVDVTFQIAKKPVSIPTLQQEYTGKEQIAKVPSSTEYSVIKNTVGIEVGLYYVSLSLNDKDNYRWVNKLETEYEIEVPFNIVKVTNSWEIIPSMGSWDYLSEEESPVAQAKFGNDYLKVSYKQYNKDGSISDLNKKPSEAGNYLAIFTVIANSNDYGDLSEEVEFSIRPFKVEIPQLNQESFYNTQVQTPTVDETYYTATCQEEIKNAKTYNVTLTLNKQSFVWYDLTTESKTLVFTINKAVNNDDVATSQTATYGQKLSEINVPTSTTGTWAWENSENKVGTVSGENNEHNLVFVPMNDNYETRTVAVTFNVNPYEVTVPTLNQESFYNTQVQTPTIDETYYTATCQEEIKNAKTYNVTLTLKDTANYVWKDNQTNANKTLTYLVKKAENTDSFDLVYTATYGDTLSKITTPTSATGTWSWEDSTVSVGTVNGENLHTLVFTPTDVANYATREVAITIDVSPYKVDSPTLEQTTTFNGNTQFPIVDQTYYTAAASETILNAKTYSVSVVLKDKANYVWKDNLTTDDKAITFIVNKANNGWKVEPNLVGEIDGTSNFNFTFDNTTQKGYAESNVGTVKYEYKLKTADNYSETIPTNVNADGYTIKFTVVADNYKDLVKTIDFNILPVTPTVTVPTFSSSSAYFGNTVNASDSNLWTNKTTAGAKYENQTVAGTFTFVIPEVKTTTASDITVNGIARKYTQTQATVTFTPTGENAANFNSCTINNGTNINVYLVCYDYEYYYHEDKKWNWSSFSYDITITEYETIFNYFSSIEKATEEVTSGKINVIPDASGEVCITRPMTIADGVTLELAYQNAEFCKNRVNTSNKATLTASNYNGFEMMTLTSKIVVGENVTITNNGTLLISGELNAGGINAPYNNPIAGNTAGKYTKIVLNSGAKIINNSTGTIKCYGYIDEATPNNGSEVVVEAGTLGMPFIMHDFRGGNFMKACSDNGITPFNQFEFRNIIPQLTMKKASSFIGYANIYALSTINNADVKFMVAGDSSAFINLSDDAYLVAKYNIEGRTSANENDKWKNGVFDMQFFGGFTSNALTISISSASINTAKVPFPLSWRQNVTLNSGIYTMNQMYKLLPGHVFTIASGADVTMGSVNVYKNITNAVPSPLPAAVVYAQDKPAARFNVYGNLTVTNIGGDVMATSTATITITGNTTYATQEVTAGQMNQVLGKNISYTINETATYDDEYNRITIS